MPVMPMGQVTTYLAERDPSRVAIICEGDTITRAELEARANQLARDMVARGVTQDAMVALVIPNSIDFYVAAVAVWKVGATPLPLSVRMPDAELQPIINLAQPALVMGVDPCRLDVTCPVLPAGYRADPSLDDSPLPPVVPTYYKALTSGGSTGRPKIIVSHTKGEWNPTEGIIRMRPGGVQLVPGPVFHNGPFTMSLMGLLCGQTLVVMTKFDAARALELIDTHKVDWVQFVPTMSHRIWRLPDEERARYDISSVQTLFSTAGPFPPGLKQRWADWIGADNIIEYYGGTEGFGSTTVTGDDAIRKPGTVGRADPALVRILDAEGRDLPAGEPGEVYFKQPANPTYHYIGAEARVRDGWETLGDIGYIDSDGYLFLVDRRTDMIVTGGENVFPAEVEAALALHPAVRDVVVVGLPDEDLGNRVHAIVDIGTDDGGAADVTVDELLGHLQDRLVRYKVPRTVELVTEPLRSEAGKVRRVQLRDERIAAAAE